MAPSQSSMSRHGNKSYCNSGIKCPILPKLHMFDKSPGLNKSEGQYSIGCGKMPRQRHLYIFNGVRLELRFTYMYKNRYTHVTHQYLQKSLLVRNSNPNRKSVILNFLCKICVVFAIFRGCTLTNSSQRFIQINTKLCQCNLKAFAMLNCEDLEVSFKGVSVAALQISMFRHEKGSCYNSDIQCPICPKLHMFEKTPDLNISTCQYSDIAIAPPAGNRK